MSRGGYDWRKHVKPRGGYSNPSLRAAPSSDDGTMQPEPYHKPASAAGGNETGVVPMSARIGGASGGGLRGTLEALFAFLTRLDNKPYPAYRDAVGTWGSTALHICLDHVQSDPYAPPSRVRCRVPNTLPSTSTSSRIRRIAACDWLTRRVSQSARAHNGTVSQSHGWHGVKGGQIEVLEPSQHVLQRSSVLLTDHAIEVRFEVGLPARGRTITGPGAAALLAQIVPALILSALTLTDASQRAHLDAHVTSVEDQAWLRQHLPSRGWVAFVADGSYPARRAGNDDLPLSLDQGMCSEMLLLPRCAFSRLWFDDAVVCDSHEDLCVDVCRVDQVLCHSSARLRYARQSTCPTAAL